MTEPTALSRFMCRLGAHHWGPPHDYTTVEIKRLRQTVGFVDYWYQDCYVCGLSKSFGRKT